VDHVLALNRRGSIPAAKIRGDFGELGKGGLEVFDLSDL
jgi:hypothetical protein